MRNKIFKFLILVISSILIVGCGKNNKSPEKKEKYSEGQYVVGTDIPVDEYIIFAEEGKKGEVCIYKDLDVSEDNIKMHREFSYNTIYTVKKNEYMELKDCYAVPMSRNPKVKTTGDGKFKVGTHIKAGKYGIIPEDDGQFDYFIYADERSEGGNIEENVKNKTFELLDGDYIEIQSASLLYENMTKEEVIEKTKDMTDDEKSSWSLECYRMGFFQNAIYGFEQIKDSSKYKGFNDMMEEFNLMLKYQGVYESSLTKDSDYIVLNGWDLYKYDYDAWNSSSVDRKVEKMAIERYEEGYYLKESDTVLLSGQLYVLYILTTGANGEETIDMRYSKDNLSILYTKNTDVTQEILEERYQTEIDRKEPCIGMNPEEVRESTWGEPKKINKTTTAGGVSEQWVYGSGKYIYVEDGVVTAIQE